MIQYIDEIPIFGNPVDPGALLQIRNCKREADYVALCADHHKGYNMPIGGVAAYADHVSPAGVGFDIACGNMAVRIDVSYLDIKGDLPKIADSIWKALSFGVGRTNDQHVDHPLFESPTWHEVPFLRSQELKATARNQLGTIGSGNHYCDVFRDENDRVWIGVHFGSRGFGHKIATEFITRAGAKPNGNMDAPPVLLESESENGCEYLAAMALAGEYAYAGRDWVCSTVASMLGGQIVEEIHNHHNFAWRERHFGKDLWVVRKGATPAAPGQKGFVGGSMGDQSVILEGLASKDSDAILNSTVHGAGRVMSRTQAAGKSKWVQGRKVRVSEGEVDMDVVRVRIAEKGVELRGAGADEAPEVYKRLPEVLEEHAGTIKILHTLEPLIVCMAGMDEFDPYKD